MPGHSLYYNFTKYSRPHYTIGISVSISNHRPKARKTRWVLQHDTHEFLPFRVCISNLEKWIPSTRAEEVKQKPELTCAKEAPESLGPGGLGEPQVPGAAFPASNPRLDGECPQVLSPSFLSSAPDWTYVSLGPRPLHAPTPRLWNGGLDAAVGNPSRGGAAWESLPTPQAWQTSSESSILLFHFYRLPREFAQSAPSRAQLLSSKIWFLSCAHYWAFQILFFISQG